MLRFIYNIVQADKKNAQADKINVKAFEKVAIAEEKIRQEQQDTRMSLEKLANRKKGILLTSMKDFIQTYEKIMQIDFQEGEGIKELKWSTLPTVLLEDIRSMSSVAGMPMTDGQTIATFIMGGVSGIIHKEAELNLSVASMRRKQANVVESQAETMAVAFDAIRQRADRISELLTKLNILFRQSIETTEKVIEERGPNRNNYTRYDKECVMTCVNLAATIKTILDTKLLDEEGQITIQSLEAINTGNEYLHKMNRVSS